MFRSSGPCDYLHYTYMVIRDKVALKPLVFEEPTSSDCHQDLICMCKGMSVCSTECVCFVQIICNESSCILIKRMNHVTIVYTISSSQVKRKHNFIIYFHESYIQYRRWNWWLPCWNHLYKDEQKLHWILLIRQPVNTPLNKVFLHAYVQ